jgi:ATP-dependent 26S proteasome regulatory subunit
VGEVVKARGKTKVLVKVNPEGKYVVDLDKNIDVTEIKPNLRVALRNDSYVLHKVGPGASAQGVGVCVCSSAQRACFGIGIQFSNKCIRFHVRVCKSDVPYVYRHA